jgi:uncharacterized membrane protein YphA (DoxX/SURF4 family)
MRFLREFSRIFTGLVFIFSGFVKGVDPLGTAYRLEDYFIAYGTTWADPLALGLSIALCSIEFLIGAALVLNLKMRFTSVILLIIMSFFTILTLLDAIYEPVSDCGCFGDAIKMTNWQTFYKNILLIAFAIFIFAERKKFLSVLSPKNQLILLLLILSGFTWFSILNYKHLPLIDFMEWKKGRDMTPDTDAESLVYLTYRNNQSGEIKEYLSPDYPWNDSVWTKNWTFVDQRTVVLGESVQHGLLAEDEEGYDVTLSLIDSPEYMFIAISYHLESASDKGISSLIQVKDSIEAQGFGFSMITSSLPEQVEEFLKLHNSEFPVYFADGVVLKSMVRANPGLMLFKSGVVIDKWHYNDFPKGDALRKLLEKLKNNE